MKLLFFDKNGRICEIVITAHPEEHVPHRPELRGIYIEHEHQWLMGSNLDIRKHIVRELDFTGEDEPLFFGKERFDNSWHGVFRIA